MYDPIHPSPPDSVRGKHRPAGRRVLRGLLIACGVVFALGVVLTVLGGVLAAVSGSPHPAPLPEQALGSAVRPSPGVTPTPRAVTPPRPGVAVTGPYAAAVEIRSFKATRDALDSFAATIRMRNVTGDPIEFMSVKVTALRGEEVVATADGIVETLDAGQTITHSPVSADTFPTNARGITYEIELD